MGRNVRRCRSGCKSSVARRTAQQPRTSCCSISLAEPHSSLSRLAPDVTAPRTVLANRLGSTSSLMTKNLSLLARPVKLLRLMVAWKLLTQVGTT